MNETHHTMKTAEELKESVRRTYAEIATQDRADNAASCCGAGGCSTEVYNIMTDDYEGLKGYAQDADLGLGCGLPTNSAGIKLGDTVLDLGSGAGNDAFVARAETGVDGRVIGVDFTPEMISKAKVTATKLGYFNVEFREGDIEQLPLSTGMVDVVVSNCVLNLVPDKRKAFSEVLRVLKPGGHFSISDVVLKGDLPSALKEAAAMYAGCVSGALQEDEYLGIIHDLGFANVTVQKRKPIILPNDILSNYMNADQITEFKAGGTGIFSITVTAEKPNDRRTDITHAILDQVACCTPKDEGTAKVELATKEKCGCEPNSPCC